MPTDGQIYGYGRNEIESTHTMWSAAALNLSEVDLVLHAIV